MRNIFANISNMPISVGTLHSGIKITIFANCNAFPCSACSGILENERQCEGKKEVFFLLVFKT